MMMRSGTMPKFIDALRDGVMRRISAKACVSLRGRERKGRSGGEAPRVGATVTPLAPATTEFQNIARRRLPCISAMRFRLASSPCIATSSTPRFQK